MKNKCDYFIIGQHFKYYEGYNYDHFNNEEYVLTYAHQIERALDIGLVKYVAHPDYFMLGRRIFSPACVEAAHIICKAVTRNNGVLEVNLNGLRYGQLYYSDGKRNAYPTRDFFKIY